MKKVVVISLGGSLIIPDKINVGFLEDFRKVILTNTKNYKFVIVCGGGSVARAYINGLKNQELRNREYLQCMLGIGCTRLNARFMSYFFGMDSDRGIPREMKEIKRLLTKNNIVFCGALRYEKNETSDSVGAKLARSLNCYFINMTDVKGLYDKDPHRFKKANFIHEISHKDFLAMARKIEFEPGQNFVLDQRAAEIIQRYKIRTFILGSNNDLNNLLNNRHFVGSIIG